MEIKTIEQKQRKLINEYSDNSMCNSNSQSANEAYSSDSQNRKLLNLGCGTGKHDREFEKLGYKVKGIDLSPKMIEIAETECIKANLSLSAAIFENTGIAAGMIFVHRCFMLLVIKYQIKTC